MLLLHVVHVHLLLLYTMGSYCSPKVFSRVVGGWRTQDLTQVVYMYMYMYSALYPYSSSKSLPGHSGYKSGVLVVHRRSFCHGGTNFAVLHLQTAVRRQDSGRPYTRATRATMTMTCIVCHNHGEPKRRSLAARPKKGRRGVPLRKRVSRCANSLAKVTTCTYMYLTTVLTSHIHNIGILAT